METTKNKIEACLLSAGCAKVLYESVQLANVKADTIGQSEVTAMVIEPTSGTINISGNGANIRFNPWRVEVLIPIKPEDTADVNIIILSDLLDVCRKFVQLLCRDGSLGKIGNVTFSKVQESRYDANAIGWAMTLSLSPITYESNC